MKFTDGKKTIEMKLMAWDNGNREGAVDVTEGLFNPDGLMKYDKDLGAYVIEDVENIETFAKNWQILVSVFSNPVKGIVFGEEDWIGSPDNSTNTELTIETI